MEKVSEGKREMIVRWHEAGYEVGYTARLLGLGEDAVRAVLAEASGGTEGAARSE